MTLLTWRAAKRTDRDALRTFTCTTDKRRSGKFGASRVKVHDRPYERVVQSLIRDRLSPTGDPDVTVLLGWSGEKLGAVVVLRRLDGWSHVLVAVIAVAMEHRNKGGGVAHEALGSALDLATTEAHGVGVDVILMNAVIHEKNRPSQRLFSSFQFEHTADRGDDYQLWSTEVLVGGGLFD